LTSVVLKYPQTKNDCRHAQIYVAKRNKCSVSSG